MAGYRRGKLFHFTMFAGKKMLGTTHRKTASPFTGLFAALILFAGLITAGGCIFSSGKGGADKPGDGKPVVSDLNIAEGDTLKTRDFMVKWKGNKYCDEYRVSIDGIESAWFDSTSFRLTELSEGGHVFSIQARNDSLVSDPLSVHFAVDASKGTRLRLSPGTISVTSPVSIFLDDAAGLMTIHVEIACPDSSARMKEFDASDAVVRAGCIVFSDTKDPYRLVLDIGFPGYKKGYSGSIELGSFLASPVKTTGLITPDPVRTLLRDTKNAPLAIEGATSVRIER